MFCDCKDILIGKEKIKIGDNIFYYCKTCNNYYELNNKITESEFMRKKEFFEKKEQDEKEKKIEERKRTFPLIDEYLKFDNGVYYVYYYVPKNKIINEEQRKFHNKILNIKNNLEFALREGFPLFKNKLRKNIEFVICVIPSSKTTKENTLIAVAKKLSGDNIIDGTGCLKRKYDVEARHKGANRDFYEEKETIKICNKQLLKDQVVLLIDDITTTGTSMEASKSLLEDAGAKKVYCLAVAKTMGYSWG